jgi:hypothetical protein
MNAHLPYDLNQRNYYLVVLLVVKVFSAMYLVFAYAVFVGGSLPLQFVIN